MSRRGRKLGGGGNDSLASSGGEVKPLPMQKAKSYFP